MSDGDTMKKTETASKAEKRWAKLDAMTAEEKHAAAMADRDAQPLTEEDFASGSLKRTPQVKIIRRALRLSQEEFAARFHIPVGTLRDWEQGRSEPDAPGRAYLTVIARKPDMVRDALGSIDIHDSLEESVLIHCTSYQPIRGARDGEAIRAYRLAVCAYREVLAGKAWRPGPERRG